VKLCGLTGGVGMGKSTTAAFFQAQKVKTVDTDCIAHQLVRPGEPALDQIQSVFGREIISGNGSLRRDKLADIVFAEPIALKKLEAILHPLIRRHWMSQVEKWRKEGHSLAVVVIPLLFETQAESNFDIIICVACSESSRYERLSARGWSLEQIRGRIAAQMSVTEKIARANFIIWAEGEMENHSRQVDSVLRRIGGWA
jgi:dephospho-CoA kinase